MGAVKKKPPADFVVRLVGVGLRPWLVPMRSLARVLAAVTRLVEQREDDDLDQAAQQSESLTDATLHLLAIREGSAEYAVAAPHHERALKLIRETGRHISKPEQAVWTEPTLSALRELSEIAKSLKCEIQFGLPRGRTRDDGVIATITPVTYSHVSSSVFVQGPTSVYAKIERVGGAVEMHCGIRLPAQPQKMVICQVASADLVRELGQYLYQHVTLSGLATWLKRGWQLKHLHITSIDGPKSGSVLDVLDRVRVASGHAWDLIEDPSAYLAEIRGE